MPTKFIEQNRRVIGELLQLVAPHSLREEGETIEERLGLRTPESLVEVRLLDPELAPDLKFRQLTIPVRDVDHLADLGARTCLITENRINFLTLPPLLSTIAIQGQGYAVSRLGRAACLRERRILYWGDLDAQGFEILAVLRREFPHAESLMMDQATWDRYAAFRQAGVRTRNQPERFALHLTEAEARLFAIIRSANERIEQERIPQEHAVTSLITAIRAG